MSDFYQSMRSLTELQLNEWRLAHLFEVTENYENIASKLRTAAVSDDGSQVEFNLIELQLKERAVALTIFGLYEHIYFQYITARKARDRARLMFLDDALDYFVNRLLPNPRLRFLWASEGGNLSCEFEASVRLHYRNCVSSDAATWDEIGPYDE